MKKSHNLLLLLSILHYLCAVLIVAVACILGMCVSRHSGNIYLLAIPAGCFFASFFVLTGWILATRRSWFYCTIVAFLELFYFLPLGVISLLILFLPPVREIFEESAASCRSAHSIVAPVSSERKISGETSAVVEGMDCVMKKSRNLLLLLSILHYLCAAFIVAAACFSGMCASRHGDDIYLLVIPAGCFFASFFAATGWLIASRRAWLFCVVVAFLELFCFLLNLYIISALAGISLLILLLPPVREIFEESAALRRSAHSSQTAVVSSGTKDSLKKHTQ
jgi:UPF0716 family protein affecting phage T7 exclusion